MATVGLTLAAIVVPQLAMRAGLQVRPRASYDVGSKLDIAALTFRDSRLTAVFFSRTSCEACLQSKEFVGRIVRAFSSRNLQTTLVTPTASEAEEEAAFAEQVGIDRAKLLTVDLAALGIRRVPAVAVVDHNGIIRMFHEGKLNESIADEFIALLD